MQLGVPSSSPGRRVLPSSRARGLLRAPETSGDWLVKGLQREGRRVATVGTRSAGLPGLAAAVTVSWLGSFSKAPSFP